MRKVADSFIFRFYGIFITKHFALKKAKNLKFDQKNFSSGRLSGHERTNARHKELCFGLHALDAL